MAALQVQFCKGSMHTLSPNSDGKLGRNKMIMLLADCVGRRLAYMGVDSLMKIMLKQNANDATVSLVFGKPEIGRRRSFASFGVFASELSLCV